MGPDDLMQMFLGHQATSIVRAGIEMGVFDRLEGEARTAEELGGALGCDARGTRVLLDALTALGLLTVEGERYALTPTSSAHLVEGKPMYLGGSARLFYSDHIVERLRKLPEAVRSGGAVTDDHAETPEHPFWEGFAEWTAGMATGGGAQLASLLGPWLEQRASSCALLDVACGTGLYGYMVAAEHPRVEVTSLDWPNVIPYARKNAERLGVADRVCFIEGDMFQVDLAGPYDVVCLSHVFHHFDEAGCARLMRRVHDALRPGGRIVVNDFVSEPGRQKEAPFPFLFSTIMLTWTQRGEAHSIERYRRLLGEAGFGPIEAHPAAGMPTTFITADR